MSLTASLMMTLYALDNTTNSFSACSVSAAARGAPWPDAAGARFASVSVSTCERWDTARHRLRRWDCLETKYLEFKTRSEERRVGKYESRWKTTVSGNR